MAQAAGTAISNPNKVEPNEITTEFQKCFMQSERWFTASYAERFQSKKINEGGDNATSRTCSYVILQQRLDINQIGQIG